MSRSSDVLLSQYGRTIGVGEGKSGVMDMGFRILKEEFTRTRTKVLDVSGEEKGI